MKLKKYRIVEGNEFPDVSSTKSNAYEMKNYKVHDDGLAYLTHYLHHKRNGVGKLYKKEAIKYTSNLVEEFLTDDKNGFIAKNVLGSLFEPTINIPFPKPYNPKFSFIDLFAGIGGFRIALQNLAGQCVFTSEYDPYCKLTYHKNFGEVPFGDIKRINEKLIPDHDILCAGFPCQPFSIAGVSKKRSLGKLHGFLDETQGTLFFDVARIIKEKRPKVIFLENVKNLISHDKGNTFKVICETLKELDYNIHYKVLDGKYYVPQHRERIFIVGFDRKVFKGKEKFVFPEPPPVNLKLRDVIEEYVEEKYTLSTHLWQYLQNYAKKHKEKGNGFGFGLTDLNGVSRTLSARYYKDGSEILIPQNGRNPRRLTPPECAKLQGFPEKFKIPVSDNQAYKQFGNSVIVPLIQAIAKSIIKVL